MFTGLLRNVYLKSGVSHSILNTVETFSCTSLNAVVQSYASRFPLNVTEVISGPLYSLNHNGLHPELIMFSFPSSKVNEQGTVTQDPLSVVTPSGIMASYTAALHPAPLKQEVDKLDAQTLKKYFNATLNFQTKQDNISCYYY